MKRFKMLVRGLGYGGLYVLAGIGLMDVVKGIHPTPRAVFGLVAGLMAGFGFLLAAATCLMAIFARKEELADVPE